MPEQSTRSWTDIDPADATELDLTKDPMTTAPLTEQQLDEITARTDAATPGPWDAKAHVHGASGCRCLSCDDPAVGFTVDHPTALDCDELVATRSGAGELNDFRRPLASCDTGPLLSFEDAEFAAHAREDVPTLLAEVRRQRTELAAVESLAPQQCPAGLHADWLVDSEYTHACPWCQIEALRTDAAAELMPAWEAVYEPGNVSDYLIGYSNSEAGAKGAAEAWMRSESEVTGRLEWVPWGDTTPMPDGYDRWLELGQQHDDGIDTDSGIVVRRRKEPTPAPLDASHGPAGDRGGETGAEGVVGRAGDSAPAGFETEISVRGWTA